jgi:hypothetical protein
MIGAAMLRPATFEEVEADTSATSQALAVVVVVALATGVGAAAGASIGVVIAGVIGAIVAWALWAFITFWVGTKLLSTPETHADWGQLARALGFAQSPGLLKAFGFIPVLGPAVFLLASIWQLVAMVVAIRQALDYRSIWRAVAVAVIGFIPYAILAAILIKII